MIGEMGNLMKLIGDPNFAAMSKALVVDAMTTLHNLKRMEAKLDFLMTAMGKVDDLERINREFAAVLERSANIGATGGAAAAGPVIDHGSGRHTLAPGGTGDGAGGTDDAGTGGSGAAGANGIARRFITRRR